MDKTILLKGKNRGFTQFFPVLPKQRFTLGKTWVKLRCQPWFRWPSHNLCYHRFIGSSIIISQWLVPMATKRWRWSIICDSDYDSDAILCYNIAIAQPSAMPTTTSELQVYLDLMRKLVDFDLDAPSFLKLIWIGSDSLSQNLVFETHNLGNNCKYKNKGKEKSKSGSVFIFDDERQHL